MSWVTDIVEWDILEPNVIPVQSSGKAREAWLLLRCGRFVLKSMRVPYRDGIISYEQLYNRNKSHFPAHLSGAYISGLLGFREGVQVLQPAISVIVCTRNRTEMLRGCLEALKDQRYGNFEIIVVDNAPLDDKTRDLAESMGVRYVLEPKPGLDRARNAGIMAAGKEIIAYTDDDARPDPYWLLAISANFADHSVTAVTGFVAPAVLATPAQHHFEYGYGGMGHGFERKVYDGGAMDDRLKLAAAGFGVGANMAYRKQWFEQGGYFDNALDVGTPSAGGGDVEMFHRVVARGGKLVYDPSVLVWHHHRGTMEELNRQVRNNGRSFVCYMLTCYRNRTVSRMSILTFALVNVMWSWQLKNLFLPGGRVSRRLLLQEIRGMFSGPMAYVRSRQQAEKLDNEHR